MKAAFFRLLDWLDRKPPLRFLLWIYLLRWLVLLPVMLVMWLWPGGGANLYDNAPGVALFIGFIILSPVLETLVECWLPYTLMRAVRGRTPPRRWWTFVLVSAGIMVVLHPMWSAVLPSFVTGSFLAYCYAHFAIEGQTRAFACSAAFHAAINLVGLVLILL